MPQGNGQASINTNIETLAFRHHGFPITSGDKLMIQMPSSSDLAEHASDLKHGEQSLKVNEGYQKVRQDRRTDGFSKPRELAWHGNLKRSINSIKKQVKKVRKFQARQRASSVEYASGTCCAVPSKTYAEPKLVVMDWALFRVEAGQCGTNAIKTYGELPDEWKDIEEGALHSRGCPSVKLGDTVFKVGRATGYTTGNWAETKTANIGRQVVNGEEIVQITYERTITGLGNMPFSLKGDSGALVFNEHGRVVGMVFGGIEGGMFSYVTHITDFFVHMKEKTNAQDVRIMEDGGDVH